MHVQNRFPFMTLESFLTSFIFLFHTPNVWGIICFPSQHCIHRIHPCLTTSSTQPSITSPMHNCNSLLLYLLLPSSASCILFSSHQVKCSLTIEIYNRRCYSSFWPPSSNSSLSRTKFLPHDLAPLPLWSYLLPSSPQFTLLKTLWTSCSCSNIGSLPLP